ncbi:type IV pilus secretin PilQ [Vibrio palustris]|uniref:Type IV pilus biogenesis and competence protein PilQ n=1 Tax=Vibrio palustris TaxID=1918946 RepID=A0A1R4B478_9VIBR|nr:type IV pilus secretin PilQ [Vibrio palustris]SJL83720.1 Type IV pilus biogenesis and competence protein PilQ precursor [Vibrio palustris]
MNTRLWSVIMYWCRGGLLLWTMMSFPALAQDEVRDTSSNLISLQFQSIEVRRVLTLLAQKHGFNVVIDEEVTGTISVNLHNVPWQRALDTILRMKGLSYQADNNVLWVAPLNVIQNYQSKANALAEHRQYQKIPVHYAKADELIEVITAKNGEDVLSTTGSVQVDKRTNSLLLHDTATHIQRVKELVSMLDVPMKQVLIEARIVTMSQGELVDIGVRWGTFQGQRPTKIAGTLEGLRPTQENSITDDLTVQLPSASPRAASIAFQVATLGPNTLLDLELSALQSESKAEIISSPRLLTTNEKPAYIEQGTEIPYLEAASSGATSVSFRKAVLSLKVTPHITPNNQMLLDLNVTQDRPGSSVAIGTGDAVAIQTQRIGTQVMVNDGETIVLGGIYQHSLTKGVEKVPLLGDLPLLGQLFRRSYEEKDKNELVIFVTPKVVIQ